MNFFGGSVNNLKMSSVGTRHRHFTVGIFGNFVPRVQRTVISAVIFRDCTDWPTAGSERVKSLRVELIS